MSRAIRIEELGAAVRRRRGDLSLKAVEQEIGVSASTLSRIERDLHEPDLDTVRKLSAWLGVPIRTGEEGSAEPTEEDVERTVEVYLRAKKDLSEEVARSIARTVGIVMEWEIEKAKRGGA